MIPTSGYRKKMRLADANLINEKSLTNGRVNEKQSMKGFHILIPLMPKRLPSNSEKNECTVKFFYNYKGIKKVKAITRSTITARATKNKTTPSRYRLFDLTSLLTD